jgi:hypothetical protein
MTDDFGRVNLMPHFLDRGAREEPYQGRHGKKQHHEREHADPNMEPEPEESADEAPSSGRHLNLRI